MLLKRPDQSIENSDLILSAVSLVGACIIALALLSDNVLRYFIETSMGQDEIARFEKIGSDARLKRGSSFTWFQASQEDILYVNDSIYSGDSPETEILLRDHSKLVLKENSIVVLRANGNDLLLELKLGGVKVTAATNHPIRLIQNGRIAEAYTEAASREITFYKNTNGEITQTAKQSQAASETLTIQDLVPKFDVIPPATKKLNQEFPNVAREVSASPELPAVLKAEVLPPETIQEIHKKVNFWFGSGYSYLNYQQEVPEFNSNIEFDSFHASSWYIAADYFFNNQLHIQTSLKNSAIKAQSSENAIVLSDKLNWLNFSLNAKYQPQNWNFQILSKQTKAYWLAGLQYHRIPILVRSSINTFNGQDSEVGMLNAGVGIEINPENRLHYDAYFRYQYPVFTDNQFNITPNFDFDGSVSAVYELSKKWDVGLFWYGQWHSYNFSYRDSFLNSDVNGLQNLFYSSFEFRFGYGF